MTNAKKIKIKITHCKIDRYVYLESKIRKTVLDLYYVFSNNIIIYTMKIIFFINVYGGG